MINLTYNYFSQKLRSARNIGLNICVCLNLYARLSKSESFTSPSMMECLFAENSFFSSSSLLNCDNPMRCELSSLLISKTSWINVTNFFIIKSPIMIISFIFSLLSFARRILSYILLFNPCNLSLALML